MHNWSFFRAGGVDQVRLEDGDDILNLRHLDQKLWLALSCPVRGLEIEEQTLRLLDTDGDGHVRPPEILAAVDWLTELLQDANGLARGEDGLRLDRLRQDTDAGRRLHAAARRMLHGLDKAGEALTVADAERAATVLAGAAHNGDGCVPPERIEDEAARAVAQDIVDCTGGAEDSSGARGITQEGIETFYAACAGYDAWLRTGEEHAALLLPLGAATGEAHAAFLRVRPKIEDYFGRCRLAAFDARAQAAVQREESAYVAAAAKDLTITVDEIANFPLALPAAGQPLPLQSGINPAWTAAMAAFAAACAPGATSLTEADLEALAARFEPYEAWLAAKQGAEVERLGASRVREILAGSSRAVLEQEVAADLAVAEEAAAMRDVEKLARLHRDFARLLRNYVNFGEFYSQQGAAFLAGKLLLDGRSLDLCFRVADAGKHAPLAAMAKTFLAYVDCTRAGEPKMQVACAFTAGDSDNLFVGRNGVFYDRQGRDWNAAIVKIVDQPISIGQAFWSPYKKLVRWVEESVAKRAAAADTAASATLQDTATKVGEAAASGKAAAGAAPKKMDIGVLAAISVAISGVTAIVGTVLEKFFELGYLMPLGILGVVLLISGPSMLIAFMKLRKRNLGPILDANGWAVNALTRINIPLGSSLTTLPKLPEGARRTLTDPFAEKRSIWPRLLLALLALGALAYALYRTNLLHRWLPDLVPPHHAETALLSDKRALLPGETALLTVRSGDDELEVYDGAGRLIAKLKVENGQAAYTAPADAAPGPLFVRDGAAPDEVELEVTAAPGK